MAYYAKIDNGMVVQVNAVDEQFFADNPERYTGTWKQTSYNTKGGVHYNPETGQTSLDQTKALRKNYAGIGMIYDESLDAFYAPQPYLSWTLNETTCWWESPIPYPDDENVYVWNENEQSWDEVE